MSGRTLVLLRHGRTAWNHEGRVQGQRDVDLDAVGLAQAAAAAPKIARLRPALLWSSDLSRAARTAAVVAGLSDVDVRHDARLREFSFGATEGLSHAELEHADPESYRHLRAGNYERVAGAEPVDAVRTRMHAVLTELLAALPDGETGVAVTHGAAIRVGVGALLGWPDEQFATLGGLRNCALVVLAEHPFGASLRLRAYDL